MIPENATTIKHICLIEPKAYNGSWGVGDTPEQANKQARKAMSQKPSKAAFRQIEVPNGHKLIVKEMINGITWYTVPEATSNQSTETYP